MEFWSGGRVGLSWTFGAEAWVAAGGLDRMMALCVGMDLVDPVDPV